MGVTKNTGNPYGFHLMEEQLEMIENYVMEGNQAVPVEEPNLADPVPKPSKRVKKLRNRFHQRDVRSPKKCTGVRSMRRFENLSYLLNMVDAEEDMHEVGSAELVEPGISAFAELFKETEKMKIWNDFINRTEEEQQRILSSSTWCQASEAAEADNSKTTSSREADHDDSWDMVPDRRIVHPAFSAEESYKRIDQNLRKVLRKKHVTLGYLYQLEEEVTSFFSECPSSIYVSHLSSSYERMLLHALCQYLGLASKSFDDGGKRQTHVENKNDYFFPPHLPLSQYLEHRDGKH